MIKKFFVYISTIFCLFASSCNNQPKKVFVTFDANGGLFSNNSSTITVEYDKGSKIFLPEEPTRADYGIVKENDAAVWKLNDKNWSFSNDLIQEDITLKCEWTLSEEMLWNISHGVIPTISDNYLTYGMYPQTHVVNQSLLSKLNFLSPSSQNEYGYYLLDNEYYYKMSSSDPFGDDNYTFSTGINIRKNRTYWFKVEPIKWRILDVDNGEYTILTDVILINKWFQKSFNGKKTLTDYQGNTDEVYCNNYQYSDIRNWLNTDFYNQAFFLNNQYIKTTEVDNSLETTGLEENPYICPNTFDKIFLLSFKDYNNTEFGFLTDEDRECKATDYALAHGAYANDNQFLNSVSYFTRSPYTINDYARIISWAGIPFDLYAYNSTYGVRPALKISLY